MSRKGVPCTGTPQMCGVGWHAAIESAIATIAPICAILRGGWVITD